MLRLYNLNQKEKEEKKEKKEKKKKKVSFKPFIVGAKPREWKFWEEGKCGCPNQQKWFSKACCENESKYITKDVDCEECGPLSWTYPDWKVEKFFLPMPAELKTNCLKVGEKIMPWEEEKTLPKKIYGNLGNLGLYKFDTSEVNSWFEIVFQDVKRIAQVPISPCFLWHCHWYRDCLNNTMLIFHTQEYCRYKEAEFEQLCPAIECQQVRNEKNSEATIRKCQQYCTLEHYRHTIIYLSKTNEFYYIDNYKTYLKNQNVDSIAQAYDVENLFRTSHKLCHELALGMVVAKQNDGIFWAPVSNVKTLICWNNEKQLAYKRKAITYCANSQLKLLREVKEGLDEIPFGPMAVLETIKSNILSCIHEYFSYSEQTQLIENINERWKQFFKKNKCETKSEEDCYLKFLNEVLHDLKNDSVSPLKPAV